MGSYSVNMPKQAGWLVYINGLEIPVCSLTVNFGVWQMPTLTLSMVPHHILTRIGAEDRLQVAVFHLDYHWDPGSPTFCLLGEFEVVGWSYNNTPRGRYINLSCVSQLQIFEQLHFYYISSLDDIATQAGGQGATEPGAKVVKVLYPASLFMEGLTEPPAVTSNETSAATEVDADNFIKRPIDFVLNVFQALLKPISTELEDERMVEAGSKYLPRSASSIPGKNFFARWLKMTGFHSRWAALPYMEDEGGTGCFPLVKATQDTNTLPALKQQLGQSVGNAGSAWELLQQVLGYMYMEILAIPAPPAALTVKKTGNILARTSTSVVTSGNRESIPTFFVKPMCTFALPPACNVVFPSMIKNYSFQENYIRQPTRVYLGEQFISDVIAAPSSSPSITNFIQNLMVTGYPVEVRKRMKDLLQSSPETTNKNFLLFAEEFYKGPVSRRMNAPPWMYMLQQIENANSSGESEASNVEQEMAAYVDEDIHSEISTSPLGALFDTYAKCEYYRSRYAERSGGVGLNWNPYITPGFPVAVFDQRSSGMDTMGYANNVSHTMSAEGTGTMSTSVNLTFMRTMPEFVGLATTIDDVALDIGPAEVIPEVREAFQVTENAHKLYRRLFYQERPMKKSAVFDWKAMMNIVRDDGYVIEDPSLYSAEGELPWYKLEPKTEYSDLFEGYDAAMRYASRPSCTLKEYIETWHQRKLPELLADATVRGEYTSFYSPTNDDNKERGAVFWGRIYNLVQGPGNVPSVEVSNMGGAPDYSSAGSAGWHPVDVSTGMPQTRDDWDARLEEYRKIVRSENGRIAPQE